MGEITIPEVRALEILKTYNGNNDVIRLYKYRAFVLKKFKITRSQADYILKFHETKAKNAKKYVEITSSFSEKLQHDKALTFFPKKIWCEKLLCETEKAYHFWGRIIDNEKTPLIDFWVPKNAIIVPEKKIELNIDYEKYNKRSPLPHQKEAIEKLLTNDRFILADGMGTGKGLENNTLIYTPSGTKKIGEINIGDKVIGSNGKPYNVTGVYPQGKKEAYKVTFNDGYSIITDDVHLWSVTTSSYGKNTKNKKNIKNYLLSTKQMYEGGKLKIKSFDNNKEYEIETYFKTKSGNNKWQIPIVEPIKFKSNKKLPIDPYLLGLILGDGHITKYGSCIFETHKDDYYELLNQYNIIHRKERQNKLSGYINLKEEINSLGLNNSRSINKFIPDIYKYTSIDNRIAILQGLMDTDGHCMNNKKNVFLGTEFSTISEKLCDDVCEIVQSLGGIARKKSRRSYYKKNGVRIECNKSYRVNIKLSNGMNPFRLKRKSELYNEPKKYSTGRYIKNIEKFGEAEFTCISVDSPDNLYVAEHCIVTHNTTVATIASLESGAKKILIVCPASLKINWKRELENYTDRPILIVEGRKWGHTFDYYIINYDIIKNYHTDVDNEENDDLKLLEKNNFDLAIVDEAHYLSNPSANRTKLLNDLLEKIPKVWLLTGTPMTSRPINYYNLLKIVNSHVTNNWQHYVRRYCGGYQFRVGNRKIWNTSGATNLDELREVTKNLVLRRLSTDIMDLPDKIIIPRFLELKSKFYDEEYGDFIKISKENKDKDTITITLNRLMKVRQIISLEKIPYTCEIIDSCIEDGKKVIVLTNFTNTLDILHDKYKKISVVVDGRMNKDKRQESVDKFQTNDKIKVFIGNIKAAGVGLTLTAAEVVIMNDLSFVPSDHSQGEDRAFRYGQKNNVLVYYPIFENTIEKIIYNILNKKKNIIDQVMGDGEYSESFGKELLNGLF